MAFDRISSKIREWARAQGAVPPMMIAAVVVGAVLGGIYGDPIEQSRPGRSMANDRIVKDYVRAIQALEDRYVVPPDKERLTRTSIMRMLHTLDPHSNFFGRRDFSEMQDEQSSRFYGIGVTVNIRNGRIYVIGVSRDMPADRAGLRYGDAIIAVDGVSTENWTQADALKHVRGERGTTVDITVERAGEARPLTVVIRRDEVPFPSVRNTFLLRPGIGYIGLTGGFNQETSEELSGAIADLKNQGMESLLLDLRRNPGGLFKQAIQVCEMFLPRGVEIVSVRGRAGRRTDQVYRSDNALPETLPMILLINGETASASEIVAGAMQDLRRAWIVGEESFGKGLVQTVFRLRGGTGLTLTTAKYYTPSGRSIQRSYDNRGFYDYFYAPRKLDGEQLVTGGGIVPDKLVKLPEENIQLRDACFEFARNLVFGQIPTLAHFHSASMGSVPRPGRNELYMKDEVIQAFRQFLRDRPELNIRDQLVQRNLEYVSRRIRAEVITADQGIEAAERFLIESDSQAMTALAELPQAKKLQREVALLATPVATRR